MAILVVAEHDNKHLKPSVANTVAAATELGGEISVLVAGSVCGEAAADAAKIAGVARVLVADAPHYAVPLAEHMAALVVSIADKFTHILAPATGFGKNFMPRAAALLDVAQVSDISAVVSPDTFVRSIYAGNALATVQSRDRIKIITVRITGFDAAGVLQRRRRTPAGLDSRSRLAQEPARLRDRQPGHGPRRCRAPVRAWQ